MLTVRDHIESKIARAREELQRVAGFLDKLPPDLGALEVDSLSLLGVSWVCLNDKSHKELGSQLATLTSQSQRFQTYGTTRTAVFRDVGPFRRVDLDRPNPECRKVRVRQLAKEMTLEFCGDIPAGYKLLEELDGA